MKFHGAGAARSVQFRTIIVRWSSRRNPPPGRSSGSLHPASSEAASGGAGTEGLQRRLPLLSRAARRETEIEQASHVIGIKIERHVGKTHTRKSKKYQTQNQSSFSSFYKFYL